MATQFQAVFFSFLDFGYSLHFHPGASGPPPFSAGGGKEGRGVNIAFFLYIIALATEIVYRHQDIATDFLYHPKFQFMCRFRRRRSNFNATAAEGRLKTKSGKFRKLILFLFRGLHI